MARFYFLISTIFCLDPEPERIIIWDFDTAKYSAKTFAMASFALPFSGRAVTDTMAGTHFFRQ